MSRVMPPKAAARPKKQTTQKKGKKNEDLVPEEVSDVEEPVKRVKRPPPSQESVLQEQNNLVESIDAQITHIRENKQGKGNNGVKFLLGLRKRAKECLQHTTRVFKQRPPRSKRGGKHPGEPKRPCSAYIFYSIAARPIIKEEHDDWDQKKITAEIGVRWNALAGDEEQVSELETYQVMAAEDKARYIREKAVFDTTRKEEEAAAAAAAATAVAATPAAKPKKAAAKPKKGGKK
jgi:hypothetical protein